jgi:hypothetical protein
LKHQHIAVYDYYFKQINDIFIGSNELRRALSYENLFTLINVLKTLWIKFASKQPGLWRTYAMENSEVLLMLFKIAMKTVEQGAQPCLCLLATVFDRDESHVLFDDPNSDNNAFHLGQNPKSHKSKRDKESPKEDDLKHKSPDADMEDEENVRKIQYLVELFVGQIKAFIEIFVVGKRSKLLRTPSTYFVKGLWESAETGNKDAIFNAILSVPMQSSSAALISFILKHKANSDEVQKDSSAVQSNLNMKDVFEFVKQSLNKANDLIFTHQNLELYSGIYPLVGSSKKPNPFSYPDGGSLFSGSSKPSTNNSNIFIFEREPCMKCYEGLSEAYILQNINDIKTEMKSNEQSQVYKLASAMAIKEVSLNMYELKGSMRVSEVSIYTNCSQTADLSAIKRDKSVWTFIMTMKVNEEKGDKKCRFPVPITA